MPFRYPPDEGRLGSSAISTGSGTRDCRNRCGCWKNVTKFKAGDHAGVGCIVNSCGTCESCKHGEEQHCDNNATLFTYGYPDKTSPSGITQGGYANNIVVKESFAIKIPKTIRLQDAAPLLCAGITTYSPLVKAFIKKGDKVGVAGIGGLGRNAILNSCKNW